MYSNLMTTTTNTTVSLSNLKTSALLDYLRTSYPVRNDPVVAEMRARVEAELDRRA